MIYVTILRLQWFRTIDHFEAIKGKNGTEKVFFAVVFQLCALSLLLWACFLFKIVARATLWAPSMLSL